MILGVYGYQDAGKTKLIEGLIAALVKKGLKVASVKHTKHSMSIDCEGKDTWRHWVSGSDPVVFSSRTETTFIKHSRMAVEDIADIVNSRFTPDVLIVEGYKDGPFPKVALGKIARTKGTVMVNPRLAKLVKYVTDAVAFEKILKALPGLDCGKCGLDCAGLARMITKGKRKMEDCRELSDIEVEIQIGDNRIPTGKFVSSIVSDTLRGMLSSLKCYEPGKSAVIRLGPNKKKSKRRR